MSLRFLPSSRFLLKSAVASKLAPTKNVVVSRMSVTGSTRDMTVLSKQSGEEYKKQVSE
jgi:hypothetical protein